MKSPNEMTTEEFALFLAVGGTTEPVAPATYPAISGSYTVIHRTTSKPGTPARLVRPLCGQATRKNYIHVITESEEIYYTEKLGSRPCAKCC